MNIEVYPKLADTYAADGDGLSVKGDTIQALEYYNTAIKKDSSFTYARKRLLAVGKM